MSLDALNEFLKKINKKLRRGEYEWPLRTKQLTLLLGESEVEFFENLASSHSLVALPEVRLPFDQAELFGIRVIKTKAASQFEAVFPLEKITNDHTESN